MTRRKAGLLPRELVARIPALRVARARPDPRCWARLETPDLDHRWWVIEYSPRTGVAYGLVQRGTETALEEFSVPDLEEAEGPGGLRIRRALGWLPQRLSMVMRWEAARTEPTS